jgi:uncharacterized protein (DUF362 family)
MDQTLPTVAIAQAASGYPAAFPFDSDERYPEYRGAVAAAGANPVYRAVRKSLELLGYDREHFNTPEWNPLGHLVKPGHRVFIKPNCCSHEYGRKKEGSTGDVFSVITHPSVVRAIADYVAIALKGRGEIVIGDNPTIDTNFARLMEVTRLDQFAAFYREVFATRCTVLDLREVWCDDLRHYGNQSLMKRLPGDPRGDTVVNLGAKSFFYGLNPLLYRGVFTNRRETIRHHHGQVQEYAVANSIFESDVYISVPKLKTHHKVGATLNIKGLVGICTKKNYLIHWRIGFPSWGGDEYPAPRRASDHLRLFAQHLAETVTPERLQGWIARKLKGHPLGRLFQIEGYRGSWEGNDTCWRMAADLYQALMSRERRCFTVMDGVVAGDGNGPFCTGRVEAGVIVSSASLLLADCAAVRLMDFKIDQVRYLKALLAREKIDLASVKVVADGYDTRDFFDARPRYLAFTPPTGWPNLSLRTAPPALKGIPV